MNRSLDSFGALRPLTDATDTYFFSVPDALKSRGIADRLPACLKILAENLLRHEDGNVVTAADIEAVLRWTPTRTNNEEVAFFPRRVLMPDSSGVPLLADLAAMRDAMAGRGHDPRIVNPLVPVDLVIDHSIIAEASGTATALAENLEKEYSLNDERYRFIRWAAQAYGNLRVLPPGKGIVHQINLEYLAAPVALIETNGKQVAIPDSLVGMDSHTPMVNALGVFGWGVGGIEAAAVMLGEPISMHIPAITGCRFTGKLREGVSATDLVLTTTQRLRAHGVVGRIVEYFGPGVQSLSLPDRATIANMAPEYGATMGFFPIDAETIRYLTQTARDPAEIMRVEAYAKAQSIWVADLGDVYTDVVEIDLDAIEPSMAGPRRPQDRHNLSEVPASFRDAASIDVKVTPAMPSDATRPLQHGDVAIAAITSCTNTANSALMVSAGLLARKARSLGLAPKSWVKTSFSPGSRVVADYLKAAGLQDDLEALGFHITGYGCMTCAGGSGPLKPDADKAAEAGIKLAAVLSGNRNFQGRVHPQIAFSFLGAPHLVIAYALAGTVLLDLTRDPLGFDANGKAIMLSDIAPSDAEVEAVLDALPSRQIYAERYTTMFEGDAKWRAMEVSGGATFNWDGRSSYLRRPPFFEESGPNDDALADIVGARILLLLGDNVTTDDISPVSAIQSRSEAGEYLLNAGVLPGQLHSFLARRVNHDVMIRGTFANRHLRNELAPGAPGGLTRLEPGGELMSVFSAARHYADLGTPVVVIAGSEYGTGSSRDWAAKGTKLLGVRAVIAESFERIHRSNLVGMGVLPLQFAEGQNRKTLQLDGSETIDIAGLADITPRCRLSCRFQRSSGETVTVELLCRVDTERELAWLRSGGVLQFVMENMARADAA